MWRWLLGFMFFAVTLHAAPPPPEAKLLDRTIKEALAAWKVPGVAVVIVNKTDTLYLQGHGTRNAKGEPVTPDTLFPLASCGKAFTAALVGMLVDDGKMNWDDRVSQHDKDFHLSDPTADALVSLRDILSHRTGMAPHDLLWYDVPWDQDETIRRLGKLPLTQPFRGGMQYQSIMYMVAGRAIAKTSGQTWETNLYERLLKPLGMTATVATTTDAFKVKDRAEGYLKNRDNILEPIRWHPFPKANAAGSIASTARDLAPWLRLHLNDGQHGDTRLISAENLRETRTPQITIRHEGPAIALSPESVQMNYAMGWVVQDYRGRLMVQHAGLIDGFRAHVTLLPKEGLAWAILANRDGTRFNLALSNTLADLLTDAPKRDWNKYFLDVVADEETATAVKEKGIADARREGTTPNATLEALAGKYTHPAYGTASVRKDGAMLVWEWGSWRVRLEHYHNDLFRMYSSHPRFNGDFLRFTIRDGKVHDFRIQELLFARD